MRVTDVSFHKVNIPLEAPTLWIGGVNTSWTRTIVRMQTDEGIEGISETTGGDATLRQLHTLKELFVGEDPFDREKVLRNLWYVPTHEGLTGKHALQALETACWDIAGKVAGRPLCQLLGGQLRDHIPAIAYVMFRMETADGLAGEKTPEAIVDYTQRVVAAHGFETIKLKGGVLSPEAELATMRELRGAFPTQHLRFDPNGLWSGATAVRIGRQLEELDLEWFEDPVLGIEGMSRARRNVRIPFATNMCSFDLGQLSQAIRASAFDVQLIDIHDWGGVSAAMRGVATCEAFQIGVGLHSGGEAGISTALCLHLAAALPTLPHAIDSFYHHQIADVITEPHRYFDGGFAVPDGPGLGVEIDEDKLRHLEKLNEQEGDRAWYEEGGVTAETRYPGTR